VDDEVDDIVIEESSFYPVDSAITAEVQQDDFWL
jgi:hypothetical protein